MKSDRLLLRSRTGGDPLVRRRGGSRVVAGVAGGVADHLGIDAAKVRVAFALLAVLGGAGIVAYALLWAFTGESAAATEAVPGERRRAAGLILLGVAGAAASGWMLSGTAGSVIGPVLVVGFGAALVWREFDADGPRSVLGMPRRPTLLTWARLAAGVTLVAVGLGVVVLARVDIESLGSSLLAVAATLVGVGLLSVPVWMRMVRSLNAERAARIRDAEREEIASHLHDSVLQTLALIQKQPDDARRVLRLARSQERDLRRWLFGGGSAHPGSLSEGLRDACAEVEDRYGVTIDPVFVGALEPPAGTSSASAAQALIAATREAAVNAARHSGERRIDVYAEAEPEAEPAADGASVVTVFVRDRGVGFDPDAVPADRRGIAGSIRARMRRNGGSTEIRTGAGHGTEVRLRMPFGGSRTAGGAETRTEEER